MLSNKLLVLMLFIWKDLNDPIYNYNTLNVCINVTSRNDDQTEAKENWHAIIRYLMQIYQQFAHSMITSGMHIWWLRT